jgi:predicted DsbA family dithiol-disulfide isomerase
MQADLMTIDYYTDILCVWAWIAQARVDELNTQLGEGIRLRYHYVDVFGDTAAKMHSQWAERGLYEGFARHVAESAAGFEKAPVNPLIWTRTRPATSANAHMVLKALELSLGQQASIDMALELRKAFFVEAADIGSMTVLRSMIRQNGYDEKAVERSLENGSAIAALMGDYQQANKIGIKGSPSYVMDGGRQTLYGNVGYRVLRANVEELLKQPSDEASWC